MSGQDYEIDLGDGRTVAVTAPSVDAARAAARNFLAREKGEKAGKSGGVDNFGRSIARGVPVIGAFADEVAAGGDATVGPILDLILGKLGAGSTNTSTAGSWKERYDENLGRERAQDKAYDKEFPVTSTAGKVAGTVAGIPAMLMAPGGATMLGAGAKTVPGMMLRGGISGAGLGAVQGYGEGEGDGRLKSALLHGVIGGAAGAVLPPVIAGAGMAYDKLAPKALPAIADFLDLLAPKVAPKSASAAAPEGGQPMVQAGIAADLADMVRGINTSGQNRAAGERIATEVQRGGGVDKARARLAELGPDAMIADTSEATRRLANIGYILPGEAADKYVAAFGARDRAAPKRFLDSLGDAKNAPSMTEAQRSLDIRVSTEGRRIYDPVLRGEDKLVISGEMQRLTEVPAIKKALDQVRADATEVGEQLTALEVAHRVKQTLNRMADAAFQSGTPINKAGMGKLADKWEEAFWNANPKVREADQAYAQIVNLGEDWLKRGRSFMLKGGTEKGEDVSLSALSADLPRATPQQRQTFEIGSTNAIRDIVQEGGPEGTRRLAKNIETNEFLRGKLSEIYGPERADQIIRQAAAERGFGATQNRVMSGSPTAQRTASIADESLQLPSSVSGSGPIADIWNKTKEYYAKLAAPNEVTRSNVADMLANPNMSQNLETLMLIQEILKRRSGARPFSAGAALTASGQAAP